MPTVPTSPVSRAGITISSTGERHIPSSIRADGSVRKEIRVRPGYRPPEDVEVYKNRTAEGFRNRAKGGVPGAEAVMKGREEEGVGEGVGLGEGVKGKNAKRREARRRAAAAAAAEMGGEAGTESKVNGEKEGGGNADVEEGTAKGSSTTPAPQPAVDLQAEKEREAKKLLKKLKQARDLKLKKDKGDKLLPEQFEKVIRINELMRQLEMLGFDKEGEAMVEDTNKVKT